MGQVFVGYCPLQRAKEQGQVFHKYFPRLSDWGVLSQRAKEKGKVFHGYFFKH